MVPGVLESFLTVALFLAITASESEGDVVEVQLKPNMKEKPQWDNLNQSTPTGVFRHGENASKPELAARTGVMDTNYTLSGGQEIILKTVPENLQFRIISKTKNVSTSGLNVTAFEHHK